MDEQDKIYQQVGIATGNFAFDERVVRVFPDMIKRSVPGYELMLKMIGLLAQRYVQPDSRVYDLGCSLGAASLAMLQAVDIPDVEFVAVDSSADMIERCREVLNEGADRPPVRLLEADICDIPVSNASVSVLNLTLQFISPDRRLPLLRRIAQGTRPGGIVLLSEKIRFEDQAEQDLQTTWHHDFKRAQGYSEMEIAGKRNALEKVLQPDSGEQHLQRLQEAGWRRPVRCFQAFNFVSYLAFR